MTLLGHYISCDDALCLECFPEPQTTPIVTGEITPDDPLAIYSDTEADHPTHCAECEDLIPHALTSAGYDYVREAADDHDRSPRWSRPEILGSWTAHYLGV